MTEIEDEMACEKNKNPQELLYTKGMRNSFYEMAFGISLDVCLGSH